MEDMNDRPIPAIPTSYKQTTYVFRSVIDMVGRYLPYVCAQVGSMRRGQIGLDVDGKIVFYLPILDIDKIGNESLHEVDEVWVVLHPHSSLTDPYS